METRLWVNRWRSDHLEPEKSETPVERARVKEMEDEIRRLRMENEFLKKRRPSCVLKGMW